MAKDYYFVFYSALAVVLLLGAQMKGKVFWQEDALSLSVSKGLLGFCAIGIMLHHMSQTIYFAGEDAGILMFMVDVGVCFVGVFFFFSGYGLYTSLRDKPDYLNGFLKKRLPVILIPFYMCNFVYIAGAALCGYSFQKGELLPYLTGYTLMNTQMWYIVEIFFLYLSFYLVFKLIKKQGAASPPAPLSFRPPRGWAVSRGSFIRICRCGLFPPPRIPASPLSVKAGFHFLRQKMGRASPGPEASAVMGKKEQFFF